MGGDDEVAFVFAVGAVEDDDEFAAFCSPVSYNHIKAMGIWQGRKSCTAVAWFADGRCTAIIVFHESPSAGPMDV